MKIFLDVGAHNGETLEVVLEPKYGFDKFTVLSLPCNAAIQLGLNIMISEFKFVNMVYGTKIVLCLYTTLEKWELQFLKISPDVIIRVYKMLNLSVPATGLAKI